MAKLNAVGFVVTDLERAVKFYRLLGVPFPEGAEKSEHGHADVVLDGGMNHNLAASGNLGQVVRRDYPIVNLSRRQTGAEETLVFVGPLCTPIDTLGRKVKIARPRVSDLIGVLQSGAYGLTASPTGFLSHPTPAEVLLRNGAYEVITSRISPFNAGQEYGCVA